MRGYTSGAVPSSISDTHLQTQLSDRASDPIQQVGEQEGQEEEPEARQAEALSEGPSRQTGAWCQSQRQAEWCFL